ncbi:MAG: hypothetical protein P8Y80_17555 [Acidobacteriota bacterium]
METRKNLAEIRTPQTLLKDAGRVHLDRYRRDLAHSSGRECVHFESAFSNTPIGMALMDMNGR